MQNSTGYLLGKLFAQLEAAGAVDMLRYITASESPKAMVPAFARLAQLGKTDAITETMNELPLDAFSDEVLSVAEHADFPLGYWHEKARMLRSEEQPDPEEMKTDNLVVRMDASLHAWTLAQGGSKFVRALLRAKRAEHL
jgi:cytochrome P450